MQKILISFTLVLILSGCGSILAVVGATGPAVETIKAVEIVKNIYDLNQLAKDEKTTTDSLLENLTHKDCSLANILDNKPVCRLDWSNTKMDDETGIEYVNPPQPNLDNIRVSL